MHCVQEWKAIPVGKDTRMVRFGAIAQRTFFACRDGDIVHADGITFS